MKDIRYKIDFIIDSPDCSLEQFAKWTRELMSNLDTWRIKEIDNYIMVMVYHNSTRLKKVAKTLLTLTRATPILKRWGFNEVTIRRTYKLILSYLIPAVWDNLTQKTPINIDSVEKIRMLIEEFINREDEDIPNNWHLATQLVWPIIDIVNKKER